MNDNTYCNTDLLRFDKRFKLMEERISLIILDNIYIKQREELHWFIFKVTSQNGYQEKEDIKLNASDESNIELD